jgi:hypothetical protein
MTRFSSWLKQFRAGFQLQFDPSFKTPILISFLLSCLTILLVLINYFSLQPVVPMFYSLAQPDEFLVPKLWLIIFPLLSSIILLVHLPLLNSIRQYEKVIQQLYVWVTTTVEFLLLLALVSILWIVS